jgi:hypothetical protein
MPLVQLFLSWQSERDLMRVSEASQLRQLEAKLNLVRTQLHDRLQKMTNLIDNYFDYESVVSLLSSVPGK